MRWRARKRTGFSVPRVSGREFQDFVAAAAGAFGSPPEGQSFFDPPDYAQAIILTHVLELPVDLHFGQKAIAVFELRDDDPFEGWADEEKAKLAMAPLPPDLPVGASPALRLVFERITVRQRLPLEAADRAFASFRRPLIGEKRWKHEEKLFRHLTKIGFAGPVSVVAATRFLRADHWPRDRANQEARLRTELHACLAFLNDFQLSLGLVLQEPRIGPINIGDLPAMAPVVMEVAPMSLGTRDGTSFVYPIHQYFPALEQDVIPEEAMLHAFALSRSHYHGGQPYFALYELLQDAIHAYNGRRPARAAVALGTAVEVLFETTIREASIALGESDARRDAILQAPLKSQVQDHLGRYASITVDLDDATNPVGRWWAGGYDLRNRVVHQNYKPTPVEVHSALDDAMALIAAIKAGLLSSRTTRRIGESLEWGPVVAAQG